MASNSTDTWIAHNYTTPSVVTYLPPVVCPLGVLLNLLALCVPLLKHNRLVSTYMYVGAIAITDIAYLMTIFIQWVIYVSYGSVPHAQCLVALFFQGWFSFLVTLMLMCVTVDRAICVCFPISHFSHRTWRRALLVSVAMMFLSLLYTLARAVLHDAAFDPRCHVIGSGAATSIYLLVNLATQLSIPLLFLITLDVLMISRIFSCQAFMGWTMKWKPSRQGTLHRRGTNVTNRDEVPEIDRRLAVMVLVTNLIYIALLIPDFVYFAVVFFSNSSPEVREKRFNTSSYEMTSYLYVINASIKVLVYMACNALFRKDLKYAFSVVGGWFFLLRQRVT